MTADAGWVDLGLSEASLAGLAAVGYARPTAVQVQAVPPLLAGRDVVAEAPTGTGKTAAFGLALLDRTRADEPFVALVLVPTRELAAQVASEITALGRPRGYRARPVTGGVRESFQLDRLADAPCIVATPGRLLDLLKRDEITLSGVEAVVIDEADRMLDEGFEPDVREVLRHVPSGRRCSLFSATLPPGVMALAHDLLHDPVVLRAGGPRGPVRHLRLNVRSGEKTDALDAVLRTVTHERALVFMRTRANVDATTRELRARGLVVDALHGERGDFERRHVIDLFRKGAARVVLATDVAARGIDVPEIDLVVNFDLPRDPDAYVHRAGRTGRMGRGGAVVSFVTPDEKPQRLTIEGAIGAPLEPMRLDVVPRPRQATRPPKAPRRRRQVPEEAEKTQPKPSRESKARRAERCGPSRPARDARDRRR